MAIGPTRCRSFPQTFADCVINGNDELRASLYAPNATLKAFGGGSSGSVAGSYVAKTVNITGQMSFHYDEALKYVDTLVGELVGRDHVELRPPRIERAVGKFSPLAVCRA